ncbi:class I SAM-dependent methyltransferase [Cryptosporangium aurantiacum]|uniref:Methyltransferase domain-containing protein n=1 Tax=Cryptosporangium aurantiacum TaxID=134849 RepID=A0A1M7RK35_9ACTN|nr:class I SAM-dependent methyltransferase [Cryptosporangium aurantiacum]SHN46428.1 Methyltransferase domain-containing protein [Cryptosporangium aurantiacum]
MSAPITPPLTARANLRWAVVRPTLERLAPKDILELGCGQGAVGARLAQLASYTGVEPDEASWNVASSRVTPNGGTVLHGDHHKVPEGAEFDLVCAFEVLEHIADDRGNLADWVQFIRAGGKLMVSVPADQHRFGPSDELVGHYRRYSVEQLTSLLESVGCTDIAVRRYGWPVGYALEAVSNRVSAKKLAEPAAPVSDVIEERGATSGRFLQPKKVAGQALKLGMAPFTLIQELAPKRGIGLIAVATGPKG